MPPMPDYLEMQPILLDNQAITVELVITAFREDLSSAMNNLAELMQKNIGNKEVFEAFKTRLELDAEDKSDAAKDFLGIALLWAVIHKDSNFVTNCSRLQPTFFALQDSKFSNARKMALKDSGYQSRPMLAWLLELCELGVDCQYIWKQKNRVFQAVNANLTLSQNLFENYFKAHDKAKAFVKHSSFILSYMIELGIEITGPILRFFKTYAADNEDVRCCLTTKKSSEKHKNHKYSILFLILQHYKIEQYEFLDWLLSFVETQPDHVIQFSDLDNKAPEHVLSGIDSVNTESALHRLAEIPYYRTKLTYDYHQPGDIDYYGTKSLLISLFKSGNEAMLRALVRHCDFEGLAVWLNLFATGSNLNDGKFSLTELMSDILIDNVYGLTEASVVQIFREEAGLLLLLFYMSARQFNIVRVILELPDPDFERRDQIFTSLIKNAIAAIDLENPSHKVQAIELPDDFDQFKKSKFNLVGTQRFYDLVTFFVACFNDFTNQQAFQQLERFLRFVRSSQHPDVGMTYYPYVIFDCKYVKELDEKLKDCKLIVAPVNANDLLRNKCDLNSLVQDENALIEALQSQQSCLADMLIHGIIISSDLIAMLDKHKTTPAVIQSLKYKGTNNETILLLATQHFKAGQMDFIRWVLQVATDETYEDFDIAYLNQGAAGIVNALKLACTAKTEILFDLFMQYKYFVSLVFEYDLENLCPFDELLQNGSPRMLEMVFQCVPLENLYNWLIQKKNLTVFEYGNVGLCQALRSRIERNIHGITQASFFEALETNTPLLVLFLYLVYRAKESEGIDSDSNYHARKDHFVNLLAKVNQLIKDKHPSFKVPELNIDNKRFRTYLGGSQRYSECLENLKLFWSFQTVGSAKHCIENFYDFLAKAKFGEDKTAQLVKDALLAAFVEHAGDLEFYLDDYESGEAVAFWQKLRHTPESLSGAIFDNQVRAEAFFEDEAKAKGLLAKHHYALRVLIECGLIIKGSIMVFLRKHQEDGFVTNCLKSCKPHYVKINAEERLQYFSILYSVLEHYYSCALSESHRDFLVWLIACSRNDSVSFSMRDFQGDAVDNVLTPVANDVRNAEALTILAKDIFLRNSLLFKAYWYTDSERHIDITAPGPLQGVLQKGSEAELRIIFRYMHFNDLACWLLKAYDAKSVKTGSYNTPRIHLFGPGNSPKNNAFGLTLAKCRMAILEEAGFLVVLLYLMKHSNSLLWGYDAFKNRKTVFSQVIGMVCDRVQYDDMGAKFGDLDVSSQLEPFKIQGVVQTRNPLSTQIFYNLMTGVMARLSEMTHYQVVLQLIRLHQLCCDAFDDDQTMSLELHLTDDCQKKLARFIDDTKVHEFADLDDDYRKEKDLQVLVHSFNENTPSKRYCQQQQVLEEIFIKDEASVIAAFNSDPRLLLSMIEKRITIKGAILDFLKAYQDQACIINNLKQQSVNNESILLAMLVRFTPDEIDFVKWLIEVSDHDDNDLSLESLNQTNDEQQFPLMVATNANMQSALIALMRYDIFKKDIFKPSEQGITPFSSVLANGTIVMLERVLQNVAIADLYPWLVNPENVKKIEGCELVFSDELLQTLDQNQHGITPERLSDLICRNAPLLIVFLYLVNRGGVGKNPADYESRKQHFARTLSTVWQASNDTRNSNGLNSAIKVNHRHFAKVFKVSLFGVELGSERFFKGMQCLDQFWSEQTCESARIYLDQFAILLKSQMDKASLDFKTDEAKLSGYLFGVVFDSYASMQTPIMGTPNPTLSQETPL